MTKVVAITGASSGIGLETAKHFADRGWRVYNLSRRPVRQPSITDLTVDVTKPDEIAAAFAQIQAEAGRLDILINNAGYGISGAIEFTELSDARRQFEVNFFGVHNCLKAALPLLKNNRGRVICISSAAAVFAIPFQSFYSATKAAVNSLVLAAANEFKLLGVSICAVQLGDVKTGFTSARAKSLVGDEAYGGAISRSVAVMEKDEQSGMLPAAIAAAIYKTALRRRVKPISTVGTTYKFLVFLNKLLPNSWVNAIIGKLYVK